MKNRYYPIALVAVALLSISHVHAHHAYKGDSPEILEWTMKTAKIIEARLNDALVHPDAANLLIKLMESYKDFDAVAMLGLYCHEARKSAELGRNYCNWLNTATHEKDLNSLTLMAQEARMQAFRMNEAANACLDWSQKHLLEATFTLTDIIRSNAEFIEHDLADGMASQDIHILSQKVRHVEQIFYDTEVLTAHLTNCDLVSNAAREGVKSCINTLAAQNWTMAKEHVLKILEQALKLKEHAAACR